MGTKRLMRRFLLVWLSLAIWALPAWSEVPQLGRGGSGHLEQGVRHGRAPEASYAYRGTAASIRDALGFGHGKVIGLHDANQATSESAFGNHCNSKVKLWGRRHPQGGSDAMISLLVAGPWNSDGHLWGSNADRNTRGANGYLIAGLQVPGPRSLDVCKRCRCCFKVAQGFYFQPFELNHRGIMKHGVFPSKWHLSAKDDLASTARRRVGEVSGGTRTLILWREHFAGQVDLRVQRPLWRAYHQDPEAVRLENLNIVADSRGERVWQSFRSSPVGTLAVVDGRGESARWSFRSLPVLGK